MGRRRAQSPRRTSTASRVNPPLAIGLEDAAACLARAHRRHGRRRRHGPRAAHRGRQGRRVRLRRRTGSAASRRRWVCCSPRSTHGGSDARSRHRGADDRAGGGARRSIATRRRPRSRRGRTGGPRRVRSLGALDRDRRCARCRAARTAPLLGMELSGRVLVTMAGGRSPTRRPRPDPAPVRSGRMATRTLNNDFERRSYWSATMPALPDRSGRRRCRTPPDVVVIGGGYAGSTRLASSRVAGAAVTLLEAKTLGLGRSTRNGGIVHAGYKWGPQPARSSATARTTGRALYRETLDGYADRQAADRRRGDRLRVPRGRPPRARLRAIARRRTSEHAGEASPRSASTTTPRPARADPRGDRVGRLPRGARRRRAARLLHSRQVLRRARRGRRPAGADLHEGVRARRSGARPTAASSSRPTAARSSPGTSSSPPTATRTGSLPRSAAGSSRSGATSSRASRCPRTWSRALAQGPGVLSTRKNFLYYWHVSADRRMIFGGRASFLPTSVDRTRGDPAPRPARGPSPARRPPDRLRLGRQRRVHRSTGCRMSGGPGRRRLRDGLLRHRASR